MHDNGQSEESDDPPRLIAEERVEFYSTDISRHPDDLVTDKDVSDVRNLCACEGKWVENLAAVSSPVRRTDYRHPHNELWLLATWTQIDILFEWRIRGKLWDRELVRVEDLPEDVDLPDYERPFNYRHGEIKDNDEEISQTGDCEEEN